MKNESVSKLPIYIFLVGFVCCCLFYTRLVIDATLIPRFLMLSFFSFSYAIFIVVYFKRLYFFYDIFQLLFFIFLIYVFLSNIWSYNLALSLVETSKNFLFLIFLIFSLFLYREYGIIFIQLLSKTILLIFSVSLLPFYFELLSLDNIDRHKIYSVTSINSHKNLYSSFIYLCSVFTFWGLFFFNKKWKFFFIIAFVFQVITIIILQTRTVYLAYIFSFILYFFASKFYKYLPIIKIKSIILYSLVSLILLNIFILFIFPNVIQEYIKIQPQDYNTETIHDISTFTERLLIWEKTYEIIFDNYLIGIGANNWRVFFPKNSLPEIYRVTDLNVAFQRPHNDFLWILSELGLIGFNIYYFIIILVVFSLLYLLKVKYDNKIVIILTGILGYFFISFFDFPKERIEHNILFVSIISLAIYYITENIYLGSFNLFKLSKQHLFFYIFLIVPISIIAFLNFKGEYLSKQIYLQKSINNNKNVLTLCESANSFCYNLDPMSVPIYWYKGNANANLKNYKQALLDFKQAYNSNPYNYHVLNDLASAFYLNNEVDTAKFFYVKASIINPRFDDPKLNLVAIYINEGNFIEAEKWNKSLFHDSQRREYYQTIIDNNKMN